MMGIREVLKQADDMKRVVMTGYQFRFDPVLKQIWVDIVSGKLGKIVAINAEFGYDLRLWHPGEDYHNLYTTHTGIVLDASHEIDYVMWLAGSRISRIRSVVGNVSGLDMTPGSEDIANILISFENGVFGNIHLNCISPKYTRWCEVIGTESTRKWDYNKGDINFDPYLKEMKWFIGCIQGILEPPVNGWGGVDVMNAALIAKHSGGMDHL
jgi:predicted dehydrogenase